MGRLIIRADTEREGGGSFSYKLYVESDDVTSSEAEAIFDECIKSLIKTEERQESALENARKIGMSEEHAKIILNKLNRIIKDSGGEEDE